MYGLEKAFAVEYATYTGNLKALGFAPDGVPTANGCISNTPAITDANSGTASNWPIRYYATGFAAAANVLPGALPTATVNCTTTFVVNTVKAALAPAGTITGSTNFSIQSIGNISTDPGTGQDTWTINDAKILTNTNIGY
jgi:hypothetical protein